MSRLSPAPENHQTSAPKIAASAARSPTESRTAPNTEPPPRARASAPSSMSSSTKTVTVKAPQNREPEPMSSNPQQLHACVTHTHADEQVLAAEPYPGAVETVRCWHAAGHWIHITSHRHPRSARATAQWLERIGLPHDDLHCS